MSLGVTLLFLGVHASCRSVFCKTCGAGVGSDLLFLVVCFHHDGRVGVGGGGVGVWGWG